jgi:GNAT superfamily N-acetyltransferase
MWEGHNPPYYQRLIEALNFNKFDDVFAYEITYDQLGCNLANASHKLQHVALTSNLDTSIRIRQVDMKRWDDEIIALHYLYNTAFRTIDGHNDMSLEKFNQMAKSVRRFLVPSLAQIAEHNGHPVGFAVALPDLNEALQRFNGSISRLGSIRLLWHVRRIRTACFKLLGVLPEYRSRGLEARLIMEVARQMVRRKYYRMEISLASEKNQDSTRIIQRLGGQVYRQYRIYEREIK